MSACPKYQSVTLIHISGDHSSCIFHDIFFHFGILARKKSFLDLFKFLVFYAENSPDYD